MSGPEGNLQVVKKVVTTVGLFGDYTAEIRQSYEVAFTPHRLQCNATQSDVTRMASLSQTPVNFHNDAYSMGAHTADFHYLCVFLVYKINAYAKILHWECNYLLGNCRGGKETKYRGICFLPDKKTLRIHGGGSTGSDDSFDFGAWQKSNPCDENKFHAVCVVG